MICSRQTSWVGRQTQPSRRHKLSVNAYAASAARIVVPANDLHQQAAIKTLGQAYINHKWCRELQIRIGKEQDLFQGLARLQLDTFSHYPVLLLSDDCSAAGVLLSSAQEQQLITALRDVDFSVIAGTLQIMQAMPEARLPKLIDQLQQLQASSAQAAAVQGHASYLKLACLGVRPEAQCKGLGTQLLGAAMARAQQEGQLLMADVADAAAAQVLERRGFKALDCSGLLLFTQMAWAPV